MLAFSNGHSFGGAFRIAPQALVDDGCLDLVDVGDGGGAARLALLLAVIRGTHLSHPLVRTTRAPTFELRFAEPPAYECDGELRRALSRDVRVRCEPGAIRVMAGAVPGAAPGSAGSSATAGAAQASSWTGPQS